MLVSVALKKNNRPNKQTKSPPKTRMELKVDMAKSSFHSIIWWDSLGNFFRMNWHQKKPAKEPFSQFFRGLLGRVKGSGTRYKLKGTQMGFFEMAPKL